MPTIDFSNVTNLRVLTHDALEVRIGDTTVWQSPQPFVEYSTFVDATPTDSYTGPFSSGSDLGLNGWTANTFFTYGAEYIGATVAGVRYWVPANSPIIGQGVKISMYQASHDADEGWGDTEAQPVMTSLIASPLVTEFPVGTLKQGWNDLRFEHTIEVVHYKHFILGVSVGDGSMYSYSEPPAGDTLYTESPGRVALSGHFGGGVRQIRGAYAMPQSPYYSWSAGYYGIDAIIQVPVSDTLYDHSIWSNIEPVDGWYHTYSGLGLGSWTSSHYYGSSMLGQTEGWTLVGARLWVPPTDRDGYGIEGVSAQCGYYVKQSGVINATDDTPEAIMNGIIATAQTAVSLTRGWNTVYFDTPVTIPIDAGFAVGWTIGDGDIYISAGLQSGTYESFDQSPFMLASSENITPERRGSYKDANGYDWSYQNNHYGSDIIVREPGH